MSLQEHTQHYLLLDGLRGVAALSVVIYHLFEAIAFAAGEAEQSMFHGFLAVDFFLILSGFVMSHAYDKRWSEMTIGSFLKRRVLRLHPLVIMGVLFGLIVYAAQGCTQWDGTALSWQRVLAGTLLALFLLPSPTTIDLRGNTEIFPLNGPHWSLFFEYIYSIVYALLLRRLSTRALAIYTATAAVALATYTLAINEPSIGMGWSSEPHNMLGGLLRISVDYPLGMMLSRLFRTRKHRELPAAPTFLIATMMLVAALCLPSLHNAHLNITYQFVCVLFIFPTVIWLSASAISPTRTRTLTLLGEMSYPLYAIHYPLIYLYISWINHGITPFGSSPYATPIVLTIAAIALALLLKPLNNIKKYRKQN